MIVSSKPLVRPVDTMRYGLNHNDSPLSRKMRWNVVISCIAKTSCRMSSLLLEICRDEAKRSSR